ncbi:RlpA lipoprotein [Aphanothece sacrum FPU1]|uniref:Probable endolytic peptidoglycan transglycosylase RlpA n=2 Tax=Aphanothece sacrum TaxID=1122 RepID=A0A401IE48_APHSA|nr:RlpA lipoprotein [Aphanothece sacrum FPU1]GBF86655.1 RlpA lipoprotein [Aphanothece sacrum FPU3]
MTTLGTTAFLTLSLQGSQAFDAKDTLNQETVETQITNPVDSSQPLTPENQNSSIVNPTATDSNSPTSENQMATLELHRWKYQLAVTVKVSQIPVITFLGSRADLAQLQHSDNPSKVESQAIIRGKALVARLNQLSQEQTFKSQSINVNINQDKRSYTITVNSQELIKLDQGTILPDTTNKLAADALQITNRLRRLMGDAPPLTAIAQTPQSGYATQGMQKRVAATRKGMASWYGPGFHGRLTANGERYNQYELTAAHRNLPFGTQVRVTNLSNGRTIIVRINDRGPYAHGRIIDLSKGAAKILGLVSSGVAPVQIEILGR